MTADTRSCIESNRALWDALVEQHFKSPMYDVDGFRAGDNRLGRIERAEVGDVSGKRLLHLLCRFGMDTLNWARLGADVTGVDISPRAIAAARALAEECGIPGRFVECEAMQTPEHVRGPFDIVFMSWGALCWLPDMSALMRMASDFLAPGGFYYVLESHPMAMALDDTWAPGEQLRLGYDYDTGGQVASYPWGADYADPYAADAPRDERLAHEWGHGLGSIVTALAEAGLVVEFLHEHPELGWKLLDGMTETADGYWLMPEMPKQVPMSYSVKARKPVG